MTEKLKPWSESLLFWGLIIQSVAYLVLLVRAFWGHRKNLVEKIIAVILFGSLIMTYFGAYKRWTARHSTKTNKWYFQLFYVLYFASLFALGTAVGASFTSPFFKPQTAKSEKHMTTGFISLIMLVIFGIGIGLDFFHLDTWIKKHL